jgi:hypothetical protein
VLFLNGVIMQNMLQLNGGVSVMPAHIKTRVFDVIPHSANLGYPIYNYITYFIIIRIVNHVKPQAVAHWCVSSILPSLPQAEANIHDVTSDCYCSVVELSCDSSNH